MRLRRLLLIHDLVGERGGAETHFQSEIDLLRERGVEVFAFGFGAPDASVRDDPNTLHFAEPRRRWLRKLLKFSFHPAAYRALRRALQRVRPDAVHLHMNTKYPLSVLLALRGVPVLQTVHSNGMFCPTGWLVHADDLGACAGGAGVHCVRHRCVPAHRLPLHVVLETLWRGLARRRLGAVVAPSRHLTEALVRFGFRNVTRLPYFSPVASGQVPTPTPGAKRLLYVGVLTRQKGVDTLIAALPAILEGHPGARLDVVGDGPESVALQALARRLGVAEQVAFVGRVPNRELAAYYREASLCVVPSRWLENSPLVAYEAMLAGRPLVGSDRGGIPDLIESGRCGRVFPAGDAEALAVQVSRLLDDPQRAAALGSNGRRYATEVLSRDAFWSRLGPLLESLAQPRV